MNAKIITHEDCLAHDPGPFHPESPDRLTSILNEMRSSYLNESLSIMDAPLGKDEALLLAHTRQYVEHVRQLAPDEGRIALDSDTIMSPGTLNAALRGVGAACQGIEALRAGETGTVFCATRPPGHHATSSAAMGFCIFNNAAIAALHARQYEGMERIALIDFDVHHGNGSQDILSGKPNILYVSTHQSPFYPGTGYREENIPGNIHNVPLNAGTDGERYREIFKREVVRTIDEFHPDLLVISAGFDAHGQDPLASLSLTEEDYYWIGQQLRALADSHCRGRSISLLEGGYNLEVLGSSVIAYLDGLTGD